MRYPKNLPEGGTIGFVAPSFGCNTEPYKSAFDNAQKKLGERGYRFDLGPNCYAGEGIGISNTPEKCAEELEAYYLSDANDCLFSCGGGELMCETISHVDFDALAKAEPKWYLGYSDNTNMTFLLPTLCDTAAVYGPCASEFGMEPWHPSLEDALGIVTGRVDTVRGYGLWEREQRKDEEHPLEPYHVTEKSEIKSYVGYHPITWSGSSVEASAAREYLTADGALEFQGRLIGGCMDCLGNLVGTRFDRVGEFVERYKEDGFIWFLESCDLNVFGIRRTMWQLEQAGWFPYVKGFLIGRPLCFGEELMGLDAYGAVLAVAGEKNVPVLMDVDLGHLSPMMPLISGSLARVRVKGNEIAVHMSRE